MPYRLSKLVSSLLRYGQKNSPDNLKSYISPSFPSKFSPSTVNHQRRGPTTMMMAESSSVHANGDGPLSTLRRSLRQMNPFKSRLFRLPATPRLSRSKKGGTKFSPLILLKFHSTWTWRRFHQLEF
jgi:hypothetical protein